MKIQIGLLAGALLISGGVAYAELNKSQTPTQSPAPQVPIAQAPTTPAPQAAQTQTPVTRSPKPKFSTQTPSRPSQIRGGFGDDGHEGSDD